MRTQNGDYNLVVAWFVGVMTGFKGHNTLQVDYKALGTHYSTARLHVVILIEEGWIESPSLSNNSHELIALMRAVITSFTRQLEQQLNAIKNVLHIQTVPQDHLFRLPHKIIIRIVAELDITGVSRCLQVCTRLRDIIKSTRLHEYKARLALANLEDGTVDSSYDIEARLAQLEAHQKAWKDFRWTKSVTISSDPKYPWNFAGGVFAQALEFPDGICHVFTQLPSSARGIEMKQWSLDCIQNDTFNYSPAQDLLVCLDSNHKIEQSRPPILIRLLSLTDGKAHPLASYPSIRVAELPAPLDSWEFTIQICGHTLAIMASPKTGLILDLVPKLYIVNWKTGKIQEVEFQLLDLIIVPERLCLKFLSNGTKGMTVRLITERYLLVCKLYFAATHIAPGPGLSIVDLEARLTRCTAITLLLPKVQGHEFMMLRVAPCHSLAHEPSHQPFLPFRASSQDDPVLVRMIVKPRKTEESEKKEKTEASEKTKKPQCFALFIPRSLLLYHARKLAFLPRAVDERVSATIPWESWGPSNTKFLQWGDGTTSCGMRMLARRSDTDPFASDRPKAERQYRIFDFNPFPMRYGFQKDSPIQLSHTIVVRSPLFSSPIVTSLPCRIIDGELSEEASWYIWNEDTLALIKVTTWFCWKAVILIRLL
ncbi:hypothetical protein WG66_005770 [Moniliophthora roreri]|nr:hypothetical protein WG66_005770 [Moniliophthora roreri]